MYSLIMDEAREGKSEHSISEIIGTKFKVSKELADKYSYYIFLSYHRIETTDKKLRRFTATDFEYFAWVLMTQWTNDKLQLELDRGFKEDIRDLKSYLLEEKSILDTYKKLVLEKMKVDDKTLAHFGTKFNQILKTILKIGAGISKSKEFEDILEDLLEKVAETCSNIESFRVDKFFKLLGKRFSALIASIHFTTRHRERLTKSWIRFLKGLRLCVQRMLAIMQKNSLVDLKFPNQVPTISISKEMLRDSK